MVRDRGLAFEPKLPTRLRDEAFEPKPPTRLGVLFFGVLLLLILGTMNH